MALLQLDPEHLVRPPVGDGGDADRRIRRQGRPGRRQHLLRRLHIDALDAGGYGKGGRAGDQSHLGAQAGQRRGDGVALLAAGAVGQHPHRVDGFGRRACGDQDVAARQGLADRAREGRHDRLEDGLGFREAAGSELAAGHGALVGANEGHAIGLEGGEIPPGGRVGPHPHIHRRRHQHRLVGGEQGGGGEVIGQAGGGLGHQVGGGGGDDDQVGGAGELDMAHLRLVGEGEEVVVDLVLGQGRQGQGGDELGARPGEDRPHGDAGLAQQPGQFQGLVGGYAAADDQEYALVGHGVRLASICALNSFSNASGQRLNYLFLICSRRIQPGRVW